MYAFIYGLIYGTDPPPKARALGAGASSPAPARMFFKSIVCLAISWWSQFIRLTYSFCSVMSFGPAIV